MGDPCDSLCGGAGCGFCGGISCEEGAFTKSTKAISFATDAETKIHEKEAKAEELFRGVCIFTAKINFLMLFYLIS